MVLKCRRLVWRLSSTPDRSSWVGDRIMSKVLLINGSPHAHGCTFTALGVVADELQKASIETEIVHVGHKDIRGCIGCYKCKQMGRCVFDKDMVNEVAKKFEEADGLVIGSPVYYAGANGTLVSFKTHTIPESTLAAIRRSRRSGRRTSTTICLFTEKRRRFGTRSGAWLPEWPPC